jgi:hypothetical protein
LNDAALIAIEPGDPRDGAVGHAHQLCLSIDRIRDAGALIIGEKKVTAIAERFDRITPGHEDRRTENLRETGETKRDRRSLRRKRARSSHRLLRGKRGEEGGEADEDETGEHLSHAKW